MPTSPSTGSLTQIPRQPWTGSIDVHLMNGRNWRVATVILEADIDTVTVRCITAPGKERDLAVISRKDFHRWLLNSRYPLIIDQTIWSTDNGINLTIYTGLTYKLPEAITTQLHEVI